MKTWALVTIVWISSINYEKGSNGKLKPFPESVNIEVIRTFESKAECLKYKELRKDSKSLMCMKAI